MTHVYEAKLDWDHGESLPYTIYRDGVPIVAIIGTAELLRTNNEDERLAELVIDGLRKGPLLDAIRAAVKKWDDRLNDGVGDQGPMPPEGYDYNAIHRMIMDGVPLPVPHVPVIKGDGFNPNGGGFAKIIVDGREFTPQQIAEAIEAMEFGR